jgi:hypothetical protein
MKIPSASPLCLLLCTGLSAIGSCSSGDQHPLVPLKNGEANHDNVVAAYKRLFSTWAQDRINETAPQNSTDPQNDTGIISHNGWPRSGGHNHSSNNPDDLCDQQDFCTPPCGCSQVCCILINDEFQFVGPLILRPSSQWFAVPKHEQTFYST